MKEEYKIIFKAPWSGQKVSILGRFASSFVLMNVLFAFGITVYSVLNDGVNKEYIWFVSVVVIGAVYVIPFLMYIILKGKAPLGWLPRR